MRFYEINYFLESNTGKICADDFENKEEIAVINLDLLISLSTLKRFTTPLTGKYIDKFAVVTMNNSDKFFIKEEAYNKLHDKLDEDKN